MFICIVIFFHPDENETVQNLDHLSVVCRPQINSKDLARTKMSICLNTSCLEEPWLQPEGLNFENSAEVYKFHPLKPISLISSNMTFKLSKEKQQGIPKWNGASDHLMAARYLVYYFFLYLSSSYNLMSIKKILKQKQYISYS